MSKVATNNYAQNQWTFPQNTGWWILLSLRRTNNKTNYMNIAEIMERGNAFRRYLSDIRQQSGVDFNWYHSDSLNGLMRIEKLLKKAQQPNFFSQFQQGKILDVGCADGDMAFFFEKELGFDITAMDRAKTNYNELQGLRYFKQKFNSKVEIIEQDIDRNIELSKDYDVAIFLGILYHLRNPLYALNMLCLHAEYVFLGTKISSHAPDGTSIRDLPVSYLLSKEELNNDSTNYWVFSLAGIRRLIERGGYTIVSELQVGDVDASTVTDEKNERYFALIKRVPHYKDIFNHHHF